MIFVDSNIPMYLVGSPHPHKVDAQRLLEKSIAEGQKLVTNAEVLQEILHRYFAIGRRDAIQPAFDTLLGLVDEVFPVTMADVTRAKDIVLGIAQLSSRDAIHIAVMEARGVERILSFDRGLDLYPGIIRIS